MAVTPTMAQVETFLQVARLGGVRRAARRMNLSQPAVSARIDALERLLGTRLFDRAPTGITLTSRGERFLVHAESLVDALDDIRLTFVDPADLGGALRLGVSETVAQSWLPDFLHRLAVRFPSLTVDMSVDISRDLRENLTARALDLAILMGPVSDFRIENLDLPRFDLGWFRAAGSGPVDLARMPVISYARNTRPYREMRDALRTRYGPGVRIFTTTSLSAGYGMIAARIGVGALPVVLARDLVARGAIERFDPGWHPEPLRFTASWQAEAGNALVAEAARIAQQVARDHLGPGDRKD